MCCESENSAPSRRYAMLLRLWQLPRHPAKPTMASTAADPFKRPIRTAACLIIGDEILSGDARLPPPPHPPACWELTPPQTVDTNSSYFAKYCFNLGIDLKRIETIADDEDEIIEAARRLSARYDLLVTSGGIGSVCTTTPLSPHED